MSECIITTGTINSNGYGLDHINIGGGWYKISTHRFVFEQTTGIKLKSGDVVMHTCDTPSCINPEHLVLGTHKENMQDKVRKGRGGWQMQPRTHCAQGHELTPENVYESKGRRKCKTCALDYIHRRRSA